MRQLDLRTAAQLRRADEAPQRSLPTRPASAPPRMRGPTMADDERTAASTGRDGSLHRPSALVTGRGAVDLGTTSSVMGARAQQIVLTRSVAFRPVRREAIDAVSTDAGCERLDAKAASRPAVVNDLNARIDGEIHRLVTEEPRRAGFVSRGLERRRRRDENANCALCTIGALFGRTSGDIALDAGVAPFDQNAGIFAVYGGGEVGTVAGSVIGRREDQVAGMGRYLTEQLDGTERAFDEFGFDESASFEDALAAMKETPSGTQFAVNFDHCSEDGDGSHWVYAENREGAVHFQDFQVNRAADEAPASAVDTIPARPESGPTISNVSFFAVSP